MPQIPQNKHRPTIDETIIDLLESIALEETALSHIINAEAEKIQAFVGKDLDFPTNPTNGDILRFNATVLRLMETLMFKELFLLRKLETVSLIGTDVDLEE
ncbi:hypothetical protein [Ammoniphilus sp. 3BR4]|uniref:hypothetical protein n=1 Tax=Ammoniphilus sp. 3BR4 TaxID=3158265 RepID=UPI003465E8AF